ncbi:MAG: universal stress protein [Candidatus Omnitrophota bacterium]
MYKKILIPLDHTDSDKTILEHIRPLARTFGAELILIHVADGYAARLQDTLNLQDSEEIKSDKRYLEKQRDVLISEGFKAQAHLFKGEPADEILAVVKKEQCDLIAMSTHGHRFLKDILFGSVAENIRHRTDVPVLMIRAKHR